MEKLELKHLAPYLPYGLKGRVNKETYLQEEHERIGELKTIDLADHNYELAVYGELGYFLCDIHEFKPILRPLSDLTKEIEYNGKIIIPINELGININWYNFEQLKHYYTLFNVYEYIKLLEWHFDVFRLIDKGLAIDINTL